MLTVFVPEIVNQTDIRAIFWLSLIWSKVLGGKYDGRVTLVHMELDADSPDGLRTFSFDLLLLSNIDIDVALLELSTLV